MEQAIRSSEGQGKLAFRFKSNEAALTRRARQEDEPHRLIPSFTIMQIAARIQCFVGIEGRCIKKNAAGPVEVEVGRGRGTSRGIGRGITIRSQNAKQRRENGLGVLGIT